MTIPLNFLTRYAIPLILSSVYLGDVDVPQQMEIFERTSRLADDALSHARKEGEYAETYDYIIVGAGSAGAIVANRLSASGEHTVLLLEAGGDPNPIYEVPIGRQFVRTGINDWNYSTVKQSVGCGDTEGYCPWPRGKALGGSSSYNGMVYNRGKPKDYDQWANFTGDTNWSWANILETYNSIEDYHGFYEDTDADFHGSGGELYIGKIDYTPGFEVVDEALREKEYPVGDLNGGNLTYGFSRGDFNIKDGLRKGTFQAFIEPILNRTNLVIYRYAYATKIETTLIDNNTVQAVGVTYERHGHLRTAGVRKDVIISAGVAESPKLLMLSGIGPKLELERLGINTILDLPAVGQYLQDHTGVHISGNVGGFLVNTTFDTEANSTDALLQYLHNGTGPFNQNGLRIVMHGMITSSKTDDRTWPDLQIFITQSYDSLRDRQEFGFYSELARASTNGSITLKSKDPAEKPVIDPNHLGEPDDVERLVDGIKAMIDVFLNTTTFQRFGVEQLARSYAPCVGIEGRDYWRCVVKRKSILVFHPTSTCRMGPDREVAVLDSKLKVFGTSNLRVVDASSIPFVPSGNTNLPAMLVGARGAEIILSGQ